MKNLKEICLIVGILVFAGLCIYTMAWIVSPDPAEAEPLDTYHSGWHLVRETASEDGASFAAVYDLTGATAGISSAFDDKDSSTVLNGGPFKIPTTRSANFGLGHSAGSKWQFLFAGENFNNVDDTFSYTVVGWTKDNGMLQVICEGNGILGTQAVDTYPDGGDAMGALISETGVTYTHSTKTFVTTGNGFAGAVVGMLARVTGTNITNNEFVQVTTVTDNNTIICSGVTSSNNNTDSTVEINPAFWADTLSNDEDTKWPKQQGNLTGTAIYNSADNEVAILVVETMGIEWIQVIIYDADAATAEEAGNITVYGRRY